MKQLEPFRAQICRYGYLDYYSLNFNTPTKAFVVLIYEMVVNQWPVPMEGLMVTRGQFVSLLYFISFHMICVLVVTNVVIAFMIDVYQSVSLEIRKSEMRKLNDDATRAKKKTDGNNNEVVNERKELWRIALDRCATECDVNTTKWHIKRHLFASGLNLYVHVFDRKVTLEHSKFKTIHDTSCNRTQVRDNLNLFG